MCEAHTTVLDKHLGKPQRLKHHGEVVGRKTLAECPNHLLQPANTEQRRRNNTTTAIGDMQSVSFSACLACHQVFRENVTAVISENMDQMSHSLLAR